MQNRCPYRNAAAIIRRHNSIALNHTTTKSISSVARTSLIFYDCGTLYTHVPEML